ncbi:uncharacterized protein E0L32_002099 [Thyridium curvatum]|uniref:Aminoglycoside phosphotransferase domain-containing protein n=1 Tax=Thyridium curvatum TaxID=1093900 RepID=A0A507ARB9_9PEZI|nr:uncharacterized protein E0L32_002034 [Thyridium curvatum]XP_030989207.1 uncharacterized protein E0L32_002099 [Thyridium curvatum]TPX07431.1 hypothetical protein E0L32_002034 [Thyridium curvatum]TPX07496.1 hypothetical protein E0L32_002099 [Thyridium curvatum]
MCQPGSPDSLLATPPRPEMAANITTPLLNPGARAPLNPTYKPTFKPLNPGQPISSSRCPCPVSVHPSNAPPAVLKRDGTKWSAEPGDLPEASWTGPGIKPRAIRAVLAPYLGLLGLSAPSFRIKEFQHGNWNKLYSIGDARHPDKYLFRVTMPVMPWYKTEAEVATMHFVRLHTRIPVPRVVIFDSSPDNAVGFEWLVMEKMPGTPYEKIEQRMDAVQKCRLAEQLADWLDELGQLEFKGIGSIYFDYYGIEAGLCQVPQSFRFGPPVLQCLLGDWRLEYEYPRQAYSTIRDFTNALIRVWDAELKDTRHSVRADLDEAKTQLDDLLESREESHFSLISGLRLLFGRRHGRVSSALQEAIDDAQSRVDYYRAELSSYRERVVDMEATRFSVVDKDDIASARSSLRKVIQAWKNHIENDREPVTSIIEHWDIDTQNILVDEHGVAVALLDWEQIHTAPHLHACFFPRLMSEDCGCCSTSASEYSHSSWQASPDCRTDDEDGIPRRRAKLPLRLRAVARDYLSKALPMCALGCLGGGRSVESYSESRSSRSASAEEGPSHRALMRDAFRRRLESLDSPWLDIQRVQGDESLAHVANIVDILQGPDITEINGVDMRGVATCDGSCRNRERWVEGN